MMKKDVMVVTKKRWIIITVMLSVVILSSLFLFVVEHYTVSKVTVEGNSHYTDDEIKNMVLTGGIHNNSLVLSLLYSDKEIKDLPFIEAMDVEVEAADSIKITVYEKALAGCVEYLGRYLYFDREGIIVESSDVTSEGILQVTGLEYGHIVLYEKLPVEDDAIFQEILNITQLLEKYKITADKLHFDKEHCMTLYFGEAKVMIGNADYIDEKVMQLQHILPEMIGKSGTLHMEEYSEDTKSVTFELD